MCSSVKWVGGGSLRWLAAHHPEKQRMLTPQKGMEVRGSEAGSGQEEGGLR